MTNKIIDITPKKRMRRRATDHRTLTPGDDWVGVNFRAEVQIYQRLFDSAKLNCRSVSQEIRFRLARDLDTNK